MNNSKLRQFVSKELKKIWENVKKQNPSIKERDIYEILMIESLNIYAPTKTNCKYRNYTIDTSYSEDLVKILDEFGLNYCVTPKRALEQNAEDYYYRHMPEFSTHEKWLFDNVTKFKIKKIACADLDKLTIKLTNSHDPSKGVFRSNAGNSWWNRKTDPTIQYQYRIKYKIDPQYPVYVVSKNRWGKNCLTVKALEIMDCPYKIIIEKNEYNKYSAFIDEDNILVLPTENNCSTPARNFAWQHAIKSGFNKHWVLDDNLLHFKRWDQNALRIIESGVFFKVLEDYMDRFSNVGILSTYYGSDIRQNDMSKKMIKFQGRCYSCLLIDHQLLDKHLDSRWEGIYNEDVDLTIRVMKAGLCTITTSTFVVTKMTTGKCTGGNQTLYDDWSLEGFAKKFDALKKKHPEYVELNNKYKDGRKHHKVNYDVYFPQQPKLKNPEWYYSLPKTFNEYNMEKCHAYKKSRNGLVLTAPDGRIKWA